MNQSVAADNVDRKIKVPSRHQQPLIADAASAGKDDDNESRIASSATSAATFSSINKNKTKNNGERKQQGQKVAGVKPAHNNMRERPPPAAVAMAAFAAAAVDLDEPQRRPAAVAEGQNPVAAVNNNDVDSLVVISDVDDSVETEWQREERKFFESSLYRATMARYKEFTRTVDRNKEKNIQGNSDTLKKNKNELSSARLSLSTSKPSNTSNESKELSVPCPQLKLQEPPPEVVRRHEEEQRLRQQQRAEQQQEQRQRRRSPFEEHQFYLDVIERYRTSVRAANRPKHPVEQSDTNSTSKSSSGSSRSSSSGSAAGGDKNLTRNVDARRKSKSSLSNTESNCTTSLSLKKTRKRKREEGPTTIGKHPSKKKKERKRLSSTSSRKEEGKEKKRKHTSSQLKSSAKIKKSDRESVKNSSHHSSQRSRETTSSSPSRDSFRIPHRPQRTYEENSGTSNDADVSSSATSTSQDVNSLDRKPPALAGERNESSTDKGNNGRHSRHYHHRRPNPYQHDDKVRHDDTRYPHALPRHLQYSEQDVRNQDANLSDESTGGGEKSMFNNNNNNSSGYQSSSSRRDRAPSCYPRNKAYILEKRKMNDIDCQQDTSTAAVSTKNSP